MDYCHGVIMNNLLERLIDIRHDLEYEKLNESSLALIHELARYMTYYAENVDVMAHTMRLLCRISSAINLLHEAIVTCTLPQLYKLVKRIRQSLDRPSSVF